MGECPLVPMLCVGTFSGRSASQPIAMAFYHGLILTDAERPKCIPTQSVGTRKTKRNKKV